MKSGGRIGLPIIAIVSCKYSI